MEALNQLGLKNARAMIEKRFTDPSSLDELGELTFQLEKNLLLAESQLNGAVQSKLDSLKRAVDLMDESSVKLTSLSSKINKIDEKIAQTNTSISNFPNLKRVHNARENLNKVIAQVESLEKVPERVEYLNKLLDESPDNLKTVYLESLKLESLRVSLTKEISVYRNRRRSISSGPGRLAGAGYAGSRPVSMGGGGGDSEDHFAKIREEVERHLLLVPRLVLNVRQRVFGNIERLWDLADNSPEDIVMSFEIVEMQHEYNLRRAAAGAGEFQGVNIRAEVINKIREVLENKTEGEFAVVPGEKVPPLTATCMATNQVLLKMLLFQEEIAPCMPEYYEPMKDFVEILESILTPRIDHLMENIAVFKVAEILDFISWVEYYKQMLEEHLGFPNRNYVKELEKHKAVLFEEYLTRMKAQVSTWFNNMKQLELDIKQSSDGVLITSNPEDMFNIIHVQLDVAREKLPSSYISRVATACLQVLRAVQNETLEYFNSQWRVLGPETMSAIINDNTRMESKTTEFKEHFMDSLADSVEKAQLEDLVDLVAQNYVNLADNGVGTLARSASSCVLEDLEEPFFLKLFQPSWAAGEKLTALLTATLTDYFNDLSGWLAAHFFAKFLKEIVLQVVMNYIMHMRKRFNGSITFDNEFISSRMVSSDHAVLKAFFEGYSADLIKGGLRPNAPMGEKSLDDALQPLLDLGVLISVPKMATVANLVRKFCDLYGLDGSRAVQAAFLSNPSIPKNERIQNAEAARKLYEQTLPAGAPAPMVREMYTSFDSGLLLPAGSGSDKARSGSSDASGTTTTSRIGGWFRRNAT